MGLLQPEHTHFKKEQSANRKGRPKGTINIATILERTLNETLTLCRVKKALYLTEVAVLPAMQRRGIDRMLLEEATRQARTLPADAIRVGALDAEGGAVGFYAKCGFRQVGRMRDQRGLPFAFFELLL